MKRTFGIALALAAAILASSKNAPAEINCTQCTGSYTTAVYTGRGATCSDAKIALWNNASLDLGSACAAGENYCNDVLIVTVSCFTNSNGKKQVSGYYTYGCQTCVITDPGGGTSK
jgi:hypothetical protein